MEGMPPRTYVRPTSESCIDAIRHRGKPVARRGRKARDLPRRQTARFPERVGRSGEVFGNDEEGRAIYRSHRGCEVAAHFCGTGTADDPGAADRGARPG